jgi:3-dehydroquinate dehydratase-2
VRLLILQGPNLDLLGTREPERYGTETLASLQARLDARALDLGVALTHLQSNHEGVLVDAVRDAWRSGTAGAVVNAAAYTHTSIALRDVFLGTRLPFVEVHLSNVGAREPFRRTNHLVDLALGSVSGLGASGYLYALDALVAHLRRDPHPTG